MGRLSLVSLVCVAVLPGCKDAAKNDAAKPAAARDGGTEPAPPTADGGNRITFSGKCDAAKITALAGAAAANPAAAPDLVARQLGDACELPPAFASFFALSAALGEDPRSLGPIGSAPQHVHKALTEICPGATAIKKEFAAKAGDERQGYLYDKCDLKRFGLMDKTSWLRGEPTLPVPFYAYHWLSKQGVAEAAAKTLATAMIMRDRRQWAMKDQELPTVAHALAPIPDGVAVFVGPSHIEVNNKRIVALADGAVDPATLHGHLIGPLYDLLAEEADKAKQMAARTGGEWDGTVVVVADTTTTHDTFVNVLYTSGRAEFSRFALVAESAPFEFGAVGVDAPKFGVGPAPDDAPDFSVQVAADGFRVKASGSDAEPLHIPNKDDGQPNLAALATAAAGHIKAHPTAEVGRVHGGEKANVGRLVQTLAMLNGPDCHTAKKSCLLPNLVFGAGGERNFDPDMMARRAGILGVLAAEERAGGFAVAKESEDVWGGLTGTEVGEAFGVGGLGLVGTGRGGGGTGEGSIGLGNVGLIGKGGGAGAGFGGRGKRVPRVRQAKATITGNLDRDIIRRIVRMHINEVRHCYNQGLLKDENLEGGASIEFVIEGTGKVSSASVSKTTLADENVGVCIAKATKRWKFPKPSDGAAVTVVYPFVLSPG